MDKRGLSYSFHVLAMVSAFGVILQVAFWIADKMTGFPFHVRMLLSGSILWTGVFWALSRWITNKNRPHR